jgi:hypothetical protein
MFATQIRRPMPVVNSQSSDDCTGATKAAAQSSGVLDIIAGAVIGLGLALVVVH